MNKYILIIFGFLVGGAVISRAETRSDRLIWTNRAATSGVYSQASSIEPTLNQFWNVLMEDSEEPVVVESRTTPVKTTTVVAKPKIEAWQTRTEKEHRGHFGINLFNLIPLIDIVHGDVVTESSDNITGRKQ